MTKHMKKKRKARIVVFNGRDAIDAMRMLSGSGHPDEFLHDATRVEVTISGQKIDPRRVRFTYVFEQEP
jgi:hypothetical protein